MTEARFKDKKITLVPIKKTRPKLSSFFRGAWEIIRNKRDTEKHFTNAALSLSISLFLNIVSLFLALFALYGFIVAVRGIIASTTISFGDIARSLFQILLAIMAALFALILRGMANEAERERDSNYLVALFSGLTGFVALIVALVALSKGAG